MECKEDGGYSVHSSVTGSRLRSFRSIDIFYEDDVNFFEILLGTHDGQIYHAALEYGNGLEIVEPFSHVLELPTGKAILDLKIAAITFEEQMVLAVTDSSLYQFTGEGMLRKML